MTHDELREVVARALAPTLYGGAEYRLTKADLRRADLALAAVWEALREPDAAATDAAWATFYRVEPGEAPSWGDVQRAMVRFIAASPLRPAACAEGVG